MKKIIDWVKESNHYYHIGLLAALSLVMMSIGAFEFGVNGIWTNVWQCVKFGALTGVVIEAYQVLISRTFDWRNTLGDLVADVIGLVLGVGAYILLAWASPYSAICLYCLAVVAVAMAFCADKWIYPALIAFLGCAMVGFSLFVYA